MTTRTDYHMISELRCKYTPAQRSIVTTAEAELIREALELNSRSNIELQNIRDMVVILYGQWANTQRQKDDAPAAMSLMDAMSAVCHVVDLEKTKRGLPV